MSVGNAEVSTACSFTIYNLTNIIQGEDKMETIIFNVEGMSCGHCVSSIEGALNGVDGVCHSKVSLADKTVEVRYETAKVEVDQLREAIEDAGYQVAA